MGNGLSLAVSVGIPLVGGMISAFTTQADVLTWYQTLKKPRWTPPSIIFGPVWSLLYISMGTASWFVYKQPFKGRQKAVALGLYGAQLFLNLIWQPLFFRAHKTDVALVDITALLGVAAAATVTMSGVHKPAVQLPLMVPYLLWVSFATALNADIMIKNPSERLVKPLKGEKAPQTAGEEVAAAGTAMAHVAEHVARRGKVGKLAPASAAIAEEVEKAGGKTN